MTHSFPCGCLRTGAGADPDGDDSDVMMAAAMEQRARDKDLLQFACRIVDEVSRAGDWRVLSPPVVHNGRKHTGVTAVWLHVERQCHVQCPPPHHCSLPNAYVRVC